MLLLDNSAWSRIVQGALSEERAETIASWIEQRELGTCLPFMLEAGYSARSGADHEAMFGELEQLPRVEITREAEKRALSAQRQLARVGHHRLAPADIVIAACAHEAGAGVLHYDGDYDLIVEHTDLSFDSVWVAKRGSAG